VTDRHGREACEHARPALPLLEADSSFADDAERMALICVLADLLDHRDEG
jgi:hypothetical protein